MTAAEDIAVPPSAGEEKNEGVLCGPKAKPAASAAPPTTAAVVCVVLSPPPSDSPNPPPPNLPAAKPAEADPPDGSSLCRCNRDVRSDDIAALCSCWKTGAEGSSDERRTGTAEEEVFPDGTERETDMDTEAAAAAAAVAAAAEAEAEGADSSAEDGCAPRLRLLAPMTGAAAAAAAAEAAFEDFFGMAAAAAATALRFKAPLCALPFLPPVAAAAAAADAAAAAGSRVLPSVQQQGGQQGQGGAHHSVLQPGYHRRTAANLPPSHLLRLPWRKAGRTAEVINPVAAAPPRLQPRRQLLVLLRHHHQSVLRAIAEQASSRFASRAGPGQVRGARRPCTRLRLPALLRQPAPY